MKALRCCVLMLIVLLQAQPAVAQQAGADPDVMTEGFLAAHPDLRWRADGARAYEEKDYPGALERFKRAAYHADKPSQAIIADMYWQGTGVEQDRAIAYAWMDIAAERLYPDFLAQREFYWARLDETQRRDAIERGQAILAEYGDDAAKPRLEKALRRGMRAMTGSRVGYVGNLVIIPHTGPLAGTGMTVRGDQYYDRKYWQPDLYWRLQDAVWEAPRKGRVDVGDVEPLKAGEGE
jgi:uncharacterized protein